MKFCVRCQTSKSEDQFGKNKSRKDNLQSYCKFCSSKLFNNYYLNNKLKHKLRVKIWKSKHPEKTSDKLHIRKTKKLIRQIKQHYPCRDCNRNFSYFLMEFDHLIDKKFNLSRFYNHKYEDVLAEIMKCDLVCIICHRLRTKNMYKTKKRISKKSNTIIYNNNQIYALKSITPCKTCNKIYDPICMDFDHKKGVKKNDTVSNLAHSRSWSKVKEEIDKCDILCAMCHRIKTHTK